MATVREPLVVLDDSLLRSIGQSVVFQGVRPEPRRRRGPAAFLAARPAVGIFPHLRHVLEEMLARDSEVLDFELVAAVAARSGRADDALERPLDQEPRRPAQPDSPGHRRHHRTQARGTGAESPQPDARGSRIPPHGRGGITRRGAGAIRTACAQARHDCAPSSPRPPTPSSPSTSTA